MTSNGLRSLSLAAMGLACGLGTTAAEKRNVLFIAVDDLRPELGCYGNTHIKSPNIDKLATQSLVFDRAYCQQAICMASRASLLSGYRPDKGKIYGCKALYTHVPNALSINKHFKANGYETVAAGKIYHHGNDYSVGWDNAAANPELLQKLSAQLKAGWKAAIPQ